MPRSQKSSGKKMRREKQTRYNKHSHFVLTPYLPKSSNTLEDNKYNKNILWYLSGRDTLGVVLNTIKGQQVLFHIFPVLHLFSTFQNP